jgi:ABC-type multidrug transport system ATPase subunit
MEEADELCHRVAFIKNGEIVALDTPHNLKLKHGERRVIVTISEHEKKIFSLLEPNDIQQMASLMSSGAIQTIHSQEATLEDVFIKLAGQEFDK